jgi:hypothetical protein
MSSSLMNNSHFNVRQSKICILLTATIDPKDMVLLKRNDPLVRQNDHINALRKWIETECSSIVFCENSGYKIDEITNIMKQCGTMKTEVLQFNGQDFPKKFGKGYGGLLIIKYAIQHSNLIKDSDYVIKVSGRYFIKNIAKIVRVLSHEKDVSVMADLRKTLTWADSLIFAFKPSFVLKYLAKSQDVLNDSEGFYLEHALARSIFRAISDGHKWLPLPFKPIIIGCSATLDTPYRGSKLRWLVGEVLHRVKNYLNTR